MREGNMMKEAEARVVWPQSQEQGQLLGDGKGKEQILFLSLQKEPGPADILISIRST